MDESLKWKVNQVYNRLTYAENYANYLIKQVESKPVSKEQQSLLRKLKTYSLENPIDFDTRHEIRRQIQSLPTPTHGTEF
eukprot:2583617-Rhodomonas_salina.1